MSRTFDLRIYKITLIPTAHLNLVAVSGIEPISHRYERCILPVNYTA